MKKNAATAFHTFVIYTDLLRCLSITDLKALYFISVTKDEKPAFGTIKYHTKIATATLKRTLSKLTETGFIIMIKEFKDGVNFHYKENVAINIDKSKYSVLDIAAAKLLSLNELQYLVCRHFYYLNRLYFGTQKSSTIRSVTNTELANLFCVSIRTIINTKNSILQTLNVSSFLDFEFCDKWEAIHKDDAVEYAKTLNQY